MTRDAALALAKKLKALAEKAEGGERAAASKKLKDFCYKHGLDEEEYSIETIRATIPFADEQERSLLSSIMCMVMEVDLVKGRLENNTFIFQCTPRQFEDITDAFRHYKRIYYDYIEGVMLSLIVKNGIKNTKPVNPEFRMEEMTPEERAEYEEMMKAARPPKKEQEEQPSPQETIPQAPPPKTNDQIDKERKDDRIRRAFAVMEENKWVKRTRPKLFLR